MELSIVTKFRDGQPQKPGPIRLSFYDQDQNSVHEHDLDLDEIDSLIEGLGIAKE